MPGLRRAKVIFDTNIWISYLIGQQLHEMTSLIAERRIEIVLCEQLLTELKEVTSRPKLKKYFDLRKVDELLDLLDTIGIKHELDSIPTLCRDPKDNFLLGLVIASGADYLITGDKDLLILNPYERTQILQPAIFMEKFDAQF